MNAVIKWVISLIGLLTFIMVLLVNIAFSLEQKFHREAVEQFPAIVLVWIPDHTVLTWDEPVSDSDILLLGKKLEDNLPFVRKTEGAEFDGAYGGGGTQKKLSIYGEDIDSFIDVDFFETADFVREQLREFDLDPKIVKFSGLNHYIIYAKADRWSYITDLENYGAVLYGLFFFFLGVDPPQV